MVLKTTSGKVRSLTRVIISGCLKDCGIMRRLQAAGSGEGGIRYIMKTRGD